MKNFLTIYKRSRKIKFPNRNYFNLKVWLMGNCVKNKISKINNNKIEILMKELKDLKCKNKRNKIRQN